MSSGEREMDALWVALGKIGGLAMIGGLIDLAMRKSEKERLTYWLTLWWDRFDSVRWSNFGRKEAELAVEILDRYAGSRLWSWRRWRFVAIVTAGAYVAAIPLVALRIWQVLVEVQPDLRLQLKDLDFFASGHLPWFAMAALLFALSLSATRLISRVAARLSGNALATATTFLALLVLHVALF